MVSSYSTLSLALGVIPHKGKGGLSGLTLATDDGFSMGQIPFVNGGMSYNVQINLGIILHAAIFSAHLDENKVKLAVKHTLVSKVVSKRICIWTDQSLENSISSWTD